MHSTGTWFYPLLQLNLVYYATLIMAANVYSVLTLCLFYNQCIEFYDENNCILQAFFITSYCTFNSSVLWSTKAGSRWLVFVQCTFGIIRESMCLKSLIV